MKVIIAGGRDFYDYKLLQDKCDYFLKGKKDIEIVSGGARGADEFGEVYAKRRGFPVKLFEADWDAHGRAAGMIRNKQMAEYADVAIVFWDSQSVGSKNMIDMMKKSNKPVRVVRYDN